MQRPTEDDIRNTVSSLIMMRDESKPRYEMAKRDIGALSEGIIGSLKDLRDQFYPGWEEVDFQEQQQCHL